MFIDVELRQGTDINLEFIFFGQCKGQLIIQAVNAQDRPIVYMLWGRPAQSKIPMLTNPKHLILKAPHPSPLSAYRGFFGCRHFSQANQFLKEHGIEPIDWQIEDI